MLKESLLEMPSKEKKNAEDKNQKNYNKVA
jgi:hypothetical protein